jgi:hypothetical protein
MKMRSQRLAKYAMRQPSQTSGAVEITCQYREEVNEKLAHRANEYAKYAIIKEP